MKNLYMISLFVIWGAVMVYFWDYDLSHPIQSLNSFLLYVVTSLMLYNEYRDKGI